MRRIHLQHSREGKQSREGSVPETDRYKREPYSAALIPAGVHLCCSRTPPHALWGTCMCVKEKSMRRSDPVCVCACALSRDQGTRDGGHMWLKTHLVTVGRGFSEAHSNLRVEKGEVISEKTILTLTLQHS